MATVLAMPSRPRNIASHPAPTYRRRIRMVNGRTWEIVERLPAPSGDTPAPIAHRMPQPPRADIQAA